jgi:threonine synthase
MKFNFQCSECHKYFEIIPDLYTCPKCSLQQNADKPLRGILEVAIEGSIGEEFDMFDLLPVERKYFPPIPVGNTKLWHPTIINKKHNFANLYIKDDSSNPTGSLKDRASFLVAAFAKKYEIENIVLASTGNAGSSMSGVGAAAGLNVILFLPQSAPKAKMVQAAQYGAKLIIVDGSYDDAYELSMQYHKQNECMSRNTAYNPMTIEGKKTAALEIFKDLGRAPDYLFVPSGDGVILSGMYKGFRDLMQFERIEKMPIVYAVQSAYSNAIYRGFHDGRFDGRKAYTIADSICVNIPKNGYHAVKQLKDYGGRCVCVSDEEILEAQLELSSYAGLFTEPAGAAAFAGFIKEKKNLKNSASIVILTTGNGLKDTESAMKMINLPDCLKENKTI